VAVPEYALHRQLAQPQLRLQVVTMGENKCVKLFITARPAQLPRLLVVPEQEPGPHYLLLLLPALPRPAHRPVVAPHEGLQAVAATSRPELWTEEIAGVLVIAEPGELGTELPALLQVFLLVRRGGRGRAGILLRLSSARLSLRPQSALVAKPDNAPQIGVVAVPPLPDGAVPEFWQNAGLAVYVFMLTQVLTGASTWNDQNRAALGA